MDPYIVILIIAVSLTGYFLVGIVVSAFLRNFIDDDDVLWVGAILWPIILAGSILKGMFEGGFFNLNSLILKLNHKIYNFREVKK